MKNVLAFLIALLIIFGVGGCVAFDIGSSLDHTITDQKALAHFKSLAQTEDVQIISKSNDL